MGIIIFFWGGGESHHKIPLTTYSCMKHHEYCWWCFLNMCSEKHHKQHNLPAYITVQRITWKLTDMKGTRLSSDLNWPYLIAQLTEHWTSKPKVVGSIPIIVKQNFCLSSLDIYSEKHHQQYIYTLPEYRYITPQHITLWILWCLQRNILVYWCNVCIPFIYINVILTHSISYLIHLYLYDLIVLVW